MKDRKVSEKIKILARRRDRIDFQITYQLKDELKEYAEIFRKIEEKHSEKKKKNNEKYDEEINKIKDLCDHPSKNVTYWNGTPYDSGFYECHICGKEISSYDIDRKVN